MSTSRRTLSLSDEELQKRVLGLRRELTAIYNGRLHSDRHKRYVEGGNSRRKLCFTDLLCHVVVIAVVKGSGYSGKMAACQERMFTTVRSCFYFAVSTLKVLFKIG